MRACETASPGWRWPLMPLPMTTCRLSQGGSRMPVHLFQKSTAGNLSLLRKSLNLRSGSNMEKALCSFIIITGQMVYPCSSAYLIKPFRLLIQQRISSGVVNVASSKPPGSSPMFLPCRISCLRFLWLTACTPHNLRIAPVTGKFRMNLLPRPTMCASGPSFTEFMSMRRLSPSTLCGWTPKMHRSSCAMISSQMISKWSKYLKGSRNLLMKSMQSWLRRSGSWIMTNASKPRKKCKSKVKIVQARTKIGTWSVNCAPAKSNSETSFWCLPKKPSSFVLLITNIRLECNIMQLSRIMPLLSPAAGIISINNFKMSSKKQQKKGGKKDKEKDKERERMAEEEARKEQQRLEAQLRINVLQKSGILDAYEYFLRAICKNGLPEANIFEFAAQQILKYQKKIKIKDGKKEQLNNRSIEKEKQVSLEKGKRLEKSAEKLDKSLDKGKPNVLPFKGEAKEEALKALKK